MNRTALVFNHGPVLGISDSLDALQEWVTTVRAPIVPDLPAHRTRRVAAVFDEQLRVVPRRREVDQEPDDAGLRFSRRPPADSTRCFRENPIGAGFFNVVGGVIVGVKPFDAGSRPTVRRWCR